MHSKGNYKQGEKTTLRMGGNNSKWSNLQRINFQNIQTAHTTQYQKENKTKQKQANQKVGERPKKRHFSEEDILILVDGWQKITEFYKAIILQLKKNNNGKKSNKFKKKNEKTVWNKTEAGW